MSNQADDKLWNLWEVLLRSEDPPAERLARYAQDPQALDGDERARLELQLARRPELRAQLSVLRSLSAAARREPARETRAPGEGLRSLWARLWPLGPLVWLPAAVAVGLTFALLADRPLPVVPQSPLPEPAAPAPARAEPPAQTAPEPFAKSAPALPAEAVIPGVESGAGAAPREPARPPRPEPARAAPARAAPAASVPAADRAAASEPADDESITAAADIVSALDDRRRLAPGEIDLTIQFAFDSAELTEQGKRGMLEVGKALRDPRLASRHILVEGHTDDVGLAEYNMKLSQERADAALVFLESHGVERERLVAVGRGEEDPVIESTSEEARAMNRRVTLKVIAPSARE